MGWKRIRAYWDFVKHMGEINWRVFYGMWKLTRLPQPTITIFGGSRIELDHPYATLARDLAKKLTEDGFSIITGGGPGIMEAANQGAFQYAQDCAKQCTGKKCDHRNCDRKLMSMGIAVSGLQIEKLNPYTHDTIIMDHFFTRKWLLVRYSVGFVVFPGGFGTLDELCEIVTLIQTEMMAPLPIVLMVREHWQPILDWINNELLKDNLIKKEDASLISCADTVDEAFEIIHEKSGGLEKPERKH